jgi:hypothetical protein
MRMCPTSPASWVGDLARLGDWGFTSIGPAQGFCRGRRVSLQKRVFACAELCIACGGPYRGADDGVVSDLIVGKVGEENIRSAGLERISVVEAGAKGYSRGADLTSGVHVVRRVADDDDLRGQKLPSEEVLCAFDCECDELPSLRRLIAKDVNCKVRDEPCAL